MNNRIKPIGYDRNSISSGILHIGVGNFHRAHEEYYTNLLMEKDPAQRNWAITGAMLLPFDEKLYRNLDAQNGEYTLTICGRDGNDSSLWIGSLKEVIWAKKKSRGNN